MSDSDPWKAAEAIATAHAGRPLKQRTDQLPYFFYYAHGRGAVLVHENKVVTERGPAVAASYLSDIGFVAGPGPDLIQVLTLLEHLEALPDLGTIDPTTYIPALANTADDDPVKPLQAKVVREGGVARIVLHYWAPRSSRGGGAPASPQKRRVYRAQLAVGSGVKPEWEIDTIEWTPPSP